MPKNPRTPNLSLLPTWRLVVKPIYQKAQNFASYPTFITPPQKLQQENFVPMNYEEIHITQQKKNHHQP